MEVILQPWPWYVSGPGIALVMALLILVGKRFGMSSNLETVCTLGGAGKFAKYFNVDISSRKWNLIVVLGAIIGGGIAANLLSPTHKVAIAEDTVEKLKGLGIKSGGEAYLPIEIFATEALTDPKSWILLLVGGFLVGFGARYAGGCTSGHSISGMSNLQLPSLVATIGFFVGGLVMVHFLFPLIFEV